MFVLKNCRLIPYLTEGFDGETADIVVDGKYIKEILPAGKESFCGMESVDMQGRTVLPGFFDMHCHLEFTDQDYAASLRRNAQEMLLDCLDYAKQFLKMGFTTVRDCGSDFYANVYTRDAVKRGTTAGARIITCGKILTPSTKGNATFGNMYQEVDDPAQMMHFARKEMENGADFLKYMVTGAVLNEGGKPGQIIATPEEIAALVKAADFLGTYVAGHCHGTEGIRQAILNGVRTIEHASYMDEECVELIVRKNCEVFTVPTLAITYTITLPEFNKDVPQEYIEKDTATIVPTINGIRMCEEAGITVGFGTDLDLYHAKLCPGLEFRARSELGLPNEMILKQATVNCAKIAGLDDVLGTVKAGKYADLVAVDGRPDEDMSCLYRLPDYVFKEGKLFTE